ncbi:hypothetical protein MAHJHV33_48300 [Mycobacterium avium subsp. hominissuis]
MRGGTAYVQSGGGVVADSNGPYEYTEATNKARAGLGHRRAPGSVSVSAAAIAPSTARALLVASVYS